jgi:hypothetical protein
MFWMRWATVLVTVAMLPRLAGAQAATGRVGGEVRDRTGAVVAHGMAHLRELDTNLDWTQAVDGTGRFLFLTLPVGRYALTVSCDRFRPVRSEFALSVGQHVDLPIRVEISGIEEQVTVATAGTIETTRTHAGTTITAREIESLAVNGRNYLDLALLAPGVSRTNTGSAQRFAETSAVPGTGISVSSQRNLNNAFVVDGLSANDDAAGLSGAFYSQEVVREFQVVTSGAPAELGRASAGAFTVVTRSGTNTPGGRGYAFWRDDALDARNPLARREDPLRVGQFGATGQGPLVRDRAFLFANVEGYDESRTGIVTIAPDASAAINGVLDRVASPGARVGSGDFIATTRYATAFARADARIGAAAQTTLRYSLYDIASSNARTAGGLNDVSRGTSLDNRDHTLAWTWQAPLAGGLMTDVRAQYVHSGLEAPANDPIGPAIGISGVANLGTATSSPTGRLNHLSEVTANVAAARGRHLVKVGADVLLNRVRIDFPGALQGSYTFASLAALDAGRYITFQQSFGEPSQSQSNPNAGVYVQDEWRLAPSVTLSAGLRYDLQWLPDPVETDYDTLAPRLGLAWSPGARRTVVRASVGRYVDRLPLRALSNALQRDGSKYRTAVLSFGQSGAPRFPETLAAYPAGVLSSVTTIDADIARGASVQTLLQVEHEIGGGAIVSAGYEHLRARDLIMSRNVNVPTLSAADAARLGIPNLGRPNLAVANDSRFGSLGDAWYDGLTLALATRRGAWLTSRVSYTLSKALDTAGNAFFSSPQTSTDIADEKGPSANDQRHRLVASATAAVPDATAGWRRALRGVQASVIASYGSALPFTITTGTDRNLDTNVNDRPAGVGRNTGRGFSTASVDLRLSRTFRTGRVRTEVLAEAFNLLNRTNLQLPNGVWGTGATPLASFGAATAAGDPRQVQLGLRVTF